MSMRRKDREMSAEYGLGVVERAEYGVLSCRDGEGLMSVPLSFANEGMTLYFHSAKSGHKTQVLEDAKAVEIVFVDRVHVPNLQSPSELRELAADVLAQNIMKIYTTEYSSAIVQGTCHLVEDEPEIRKALQLICAKYTPDYLEWFDLAMERSLSVVSVYKVLISSITAKCKRYDRHGVEMKWQRMDED